MGLSVYSDADSTVPLDKNTAIVEKRYREMGGEIKVIVKPKGWHHSHSLKDPPPIVESILENLDSSAESAYR